MYLKDRIKQDIPKELHETVLSIANEAYKLGQEDMQRLAKHRVIMAAGHESPTMQRQIIHDNIHHTSIRDTLP